MQTGKREMHPPIDSFPIRCSTSISSAWKCSDPPILPRTPHMQIIAPGVLTARSCGCRDTHRRVGQTPHPTQTQQKVTHRSIHSHEPQANRSLSLCMCLSIPSPAPPVGISVAARQP
mmetsp:Transcript_33636/g.97034  ORF Transcript_33636/g.97034 Transcript_33636/m.97034 type:complete len:117 (-) Transcript_33636:12-362(-)